MGGGKTEISLDEATNEISVKGVNVLTTQPAVGDIVCYDESRKIRFIVCDTFHAGTFPSAWETVGVVVIRKGNQVTICSKNNEAKKFMEVYPYVVSGYTLDGSEHTVQLRLHGKPTTSTYYEFKYTANTDSEFVQQLKQFLQTNGETDWSAYLMDGKVYLQYDNYTDLEYLTANVTQSIGLTLIARPGEVHPLTPNFTLSYGGVSYGIWNSCRVKQVKVDDTQSATSNPATDVTSIPTYPVCWPAFAGTSEYQEDHCLWLRQQYCADPAHPTIEEWEKYIDSLLPVLPCMTGGMKPAFRDGKSFSEKLGSIEYQATDGSRKKLFTGVVYCSEFMDGQGYLPTPAEFIAAFGNITYGLTGVTRDKADPINRSLYAIGGTGISCAKGAWLGAMSGFHGNIVTGGSGNFDNQAYCASMTCIPFARIELPVE